MEQSVHMLISHIPIEKGISQSLAFLTQIYQSNPITRDCQTNSNGEPFYKAADQYYLKY